MVKKRSTTISLSPDWDKVIKGQQQQHEEVKEEELYKIPEYDKSVTFPTESSYNGKFDVLGMTNKGNYLYAHGAKYVGQFHNGTFHGEGTLIYPMGQQLKGLWDHGFLVSYKFVFSDGLEYEDDWKYCKMPDRRFHVCMRQGLQPAGKEFITNQQPQREVLRDCYDVVDGFYHPVHMAITVQRDPDDYLNLEKSQEEETENPARDFYLKQPSKRVDVETHEWIVKHCRKAWDENVGYRPEFYEDWISGRRRELRGMTEKYANLKVENGDEDETPAVSECEMERRRSTPLYAGGWMEG